MSSVFHRLHKLNHNLVFQKLFALMTQIKPISYPWKISSVDVSCGGFLNEKPDEMKATNVIFHNRPFAPLFSPAHQIHKLPSPLLLHHTIREVTGHMPLVALESLVDHTVLNNLEDDISLGFIVSVITSSYSRIYRR